MTRGEYVARAADCISCHTSPGVGAFAGGGGLKSPFGLIYAPNITPDIRTGIGSWSKADFEKAVRLGVRKDGAYLYPAMPYASYTKMSNQDLDALWAYMRTVRAVEHSVPSNTLPFPLTVRSGIAAWQGLYFQPGRFEPTPNRSVVWNRGAYLVEVLGHCEECHTPRNVAQGLQPAHRLTGASISGWYAPNIGNDPVSKVADWRVEQLAHYFKTGETPRNGNAIGPMQEVINDSLRYLSDSDLHAMAVFLKEQPDVGSPRPASRARLPADRLSAGRQVYEDNCESCHQRNGQGQPGTIPSLAGNDAVTAAEPFNVVMAILEGLPAQGTWGPMGSFANDLTDDQVADVTNYIRTAWNNGAVPNATPWSISRMRDNANVSERQPKALLCPTLKQEVLEPALANSADSLKQAATQADRMTAVIGRYRAARPQASEADTIEALSAAYCRVLASSPISTPHMTLMLGEFSQRVAVVWEKRP